MEATRRGCTRPEAARLLTLCLSHSTSSFTTSTYMYLRVRNEAEASYFVDVTVLGLVASYVAGNQAQAQASYVGNF